MKGKTIFIVMFLAGLVVLPHSCSRAESHQPPNIIFILADDLGAGDLQCSGHPYVRTPHLDRLAENGIRFKRAYMAGAWCAPSRYGIMSGQFPGRDFDRTRNLKPYEPSVTKILKDAGYHTAHFGKWHMTQGTEYSDSPADFGIDEHFLHNYKGGEANTWSPEEKQKEYWRAHSTDAYVDMTIDYIKRHDPAETSAPFYVNLWIFPTHSYIHPTPGQLKEYEGLEVEIEDFSEYQQAFLRFVARHGDIDEAMQAYCADVTSMDKALGRLFRFLEKEELTDNTLVVFTSDNGPGPLTHQVQRGTVVKRYRERPDLLNSVGSASIYRERKVSLHEGGIRVPFIVSWPGNTPRGMVDKTTVVHGTDWLPTVASVCGIELPDGVYDGVNVEPALLGDTLERDKPVFWTQAGEVAMLQDPWKGILSNDGTFELYQVRKDPGEKMNVADEYAETAARIEGMIRDWKAEQMDQNE